MKVLQELEQQEKYTLFCDCKNGKKKRNSKIQLYDKSVAVNTKYGKLEVQRYSSLTEIHTQKR